MADLVRHQAAVIAVTGTAETVLAAKEATATIPIVFTIGNDPVKAGLIAALNKPGANITGVTTMNAQLGSKWVGLMHDLLPRATRFALLVNPGAGTEMVADTQEAATAIGLKIEVVYADTSDELEIGVAGIAQKQAGALMIVPDALFFDRRAQIAALALRHGLPAIYVNQAFPEAGGLMSYGSDWTNTFRQVGVYCGRILKGAKPGRPARPASDQVPFRHQPENCQGARPHYLRQFAHAHRRADRIDAVLLCTLLHMLRSQIGTSPT